MNELSEFLRKILRSAMLFLSVCLLVWAIVPDLKIYAAGLILGTVISLANARILELKIYKITEVALANTGKRVNSGFIARVSLVLIGTMTSIKFPHFHMVFTIIGFFYVQLATIFLGFLLGRKIT